MSHHKIKYTQIEGTREFRASCSCRQNSKIGTRQEAEDWVFKHRQQVQRARAHLMGHPSLTNQYNYYRRQEKDPNISAEDRALWKQLADELEPRLPSSATDDPTLW